MLAFGGLVLCASQDRAGPLPVLPSRDVLRRDVSDRWLHTVIVGEACLACPPDRIANCRAPNTAHQGVRSSILPLR